MKMDYRKSFVYLLTASVLGSALVAVVAIMAGGFNDTVGKSIGTLAIVVVHSFVLLGLFAMQDAKPKKERTKTFNDIYGISLLVITGLVVFSTIFSVWAVWAEDGIIAAKFYASAFTIVFTVLPIEAMYRIGSKNKGILKWVGLAGAAVSLLALTMFISGIWAEFDNLPEYYGRAIASATVLASSFLILNTLLYGFHLHTDKSAENVLITDKRGEADKAVYIILILSFLFFVAPFGAAITGGLIDYIENPSGTRYDSDPYNYDDDFWYN